MYQCPECANVSEEGGRCEDCNVALDKLEIENEEQSLDEEIA